MQRPKACDNEIKRTITQTNLPRQENRWRLLPKELRNLFCSSQYMRIKCHSCWIYSCCRSVFWIPRLRQEVAWESASPQTLASIQRCKYCAKTINHFPELFSDSFKLNSRRSPSNLSENWALADPKACELRHWLTSKSAKDQSFQQRLRFTWQCFKLICLANSIMFKKIKHKKQIKRSRLMTKLTNFFI